MTRRMAQVADLALWVAAVLGVAAVTVTVMLAVNGARPLIVSSGSMGDAYPSGSLAVIYKVDPAEVKKGDVLNLKGDNGATVLHRVVEVERTDEGTVVRTKGDANESVDEPQLLVGAWRAGAHVPYAGRVAGLFRTPFAGFALAVVLLGPLALARTTESGGQQPLPA